jgi:hypothetical protein
MNEITALLPHQVFVFGANEGGFHGAGAAGMAFRGVSANTWRDDTKFLKAKNSPVGSPDRIGKWAVFGVARGLQKGHEGMSYGIVTIVRPGLKRSTPPGDILSQIVKLLHFAAAHPELEFLMTPIGAGLSGYTATEMARLLHKALTLYAKPANLIIPDDLYGSVDWKTT